MELISPHQTAGPQLLEKPENRGNERRPARGSVQLYQEGQEEPLLVQLVNASSSGVRIRLPNDCLRPGDPVRLRYPWGEVQARVVWCSNGLPYEAGLFVP